jgi:hypothetical protein
MPRRSHAAKAPGRRGRPDPSAEILAQAIPHHGSLREAPPTRIGQYVFGDIERKHPHSPIRVSGIRRLADPVFAAVFDAPLEGEAGKNKDAAIVLAGRIKLIVSGEYRQGTAAQAIVEVVDAARHLDPAALEGGAELVVQGNDFISAVHATSAVQIKRRIAHPLPWLGQHVSAGRRWAFGRREAREGFEQQCLRATAGGHAMEQVHHGAQPGVAGGDERNEEIGKPEVGAV